MRRRCTHVDTRLRFLDIAEVDRVDGAAGVRDHGGFHVAQEGPLRGAEEGVGFHIRGAGAGADAAEFVFDEEFANEGFAEARGRRVSIGSRHGWVTKGRHGWGRPLNASWTAYFDICGAPECSGKGTSSRRMFAKVAFLFLPLKGVVPKSIS